MARKLTKAQRRSFREVIAAHGYTQTDLMNLIGRARASDLFTGKRPVTVRRMLAIHKAWGIPLDELFWTAIAHEALTPEDISHG